MKIIAATSTMALALVMAACGPGQPSRAPGDRADAPAAPAPAPSPAPAAGGGGGTAGGDGSPIVLASLSGDDVSAAVLEGELACSFAVEDAGPLLFAKGNVASQAPAWGVVKPGDSVERVSTPGGFDAMLRGATFHGRGMTIEVKVTGAARDGGESPPQPARLTYRRADGASRHHDGQWQCGP